MATTKKTTTKQAADKKPKTAAAKKTAVKTTGIKPNKTARAAKKPGGKSVLFTAGEAGPFIRSGGLGDVMEALPQALVKLGADARVMVPLYLEVPEKIKSTMKFLGSVHVPLAWRFVYCGVFMLVRDGVTYYFLDNEYYFKRDGLYGHYDDAERYAFFSKACLEVLKLIDFYPDIINANDWHSALVPVFLDADYRNAEGYQNIKTVFTIHNIEFQGKYGKEVLKDILGLPEGLESWVEYENYVNFMKGGIERANAVSTVSQTYAREIREPFYSYGLHHILNTRSYKIAGIINGIDTTLYDPKTDPALWKNYSIKTAADKEINKRELLKFVGLPYCEEGKEAPPVCRGQKMPLIGMVTRLTEQKGLDLVLRVIDDLLAKDVQLIVLGKGDWRYENALKEVQQRYENKFRVLINFSKDLAGKIYAGSDIFLMPSKFEPCGLSQMIAMRYGTIPVVREVGGLKDTVQPFNPLTKTGLGFTFYGYNAYDMLDAICRAVSSYYIKDEWNALIQNTMSSDFGWEASAKKYLELYDKL